MGIAWCIEARLGSDGYRRAIDDARFFLTDEINAVGEWRLGTDEAARIRQPILLLEGANSGMVGPLFRQVTERVSSLLPHAEVQVIGGVGHAMPLQDPDAVGRAIATLVRRHTREAIVRNGPKLP